MSSNAAATAMAMAVNAGNASGQAGTTGGHGAGYGHTHGSSDNQDDVSATPSSDSKYNTSPGKAQNTATTATSKSDKANQPQQASAADDGAAAPHIPSNKVLRPIITEEQVSRHSSNSSLNNLNKHRNILQRKGSNTSRRSQEDPHQTTGKQTQSRLVTRTGTTHSKDALPHTNSRGHLDSNAHLPVVPTGAGRRARGVSVTPSINLPRMGAPSESRGVDPQAAGPTSKMNTAVRYEKRRAARRRAVRRIFIGWCIGVIIAAIIGVPARLANRNANVLGVTYGSWGVIIAIYVTMWPVCRLLVEIALFIVHLFGDRMRSVTWRQMKMLDDARVALTYSLWALGLALSFEPFIQLKFLPRAYSYRSANLWWINRILAVNVLLGFALVLRRFALTRLSMGKRMVGYVHDVQKSIMIQDILQWLSNDIPDAVLDTPLRLLRRSRLKTRQESEDERKALLEEQEKQEAARRLQTFFLRNLMPQALLSTSTNTAPAAGNKSSSSSTPAATGPSTTSSAGLGSFHPSSDGAAPPPAAAGTAPAANPAPATTAAAAEKPTAPNHGFWSRRRAGKRVRSPTNPLAQRSATPPPEIPINDQGDNDSEEDLLTLDLFESFQDVKGEPHRVCRGFSRMSSSSKARRLGYAVYDYYRGSARAVPLAKLMAPVRKNGTAEHVVVALEVLQEGEAKTSFNEDAMLSIFTSVYQKRKNLSLSLLNLESITAALGDFLSGAVGVLTVILLNIVFSTGDLAEVAITVSSAILGLSFIFSTSAQQTFNSFIFLFVRHAYDIGDRVTVPGPEVMNVVKMELLHTHFRQWDGLYLTLPNAVLQSSPIYNYSRSGNMTHPLMFFVDMDTPQWKLDKLEKSFFDFLAASPKWFNKADSALLYRDCPSGNALKLGFYSAHRNNFSNGEHVQRQDLLIRHLKHTMDDLGIGFFTQTQRNFNRVWDYARPQYRGPHPGEYVQGHDYMAEPPPANAGAQPPSYQSSHQPPPMATIPESGHGTPMPNTAAGAAAVFSHIRV